MKLLRLRTAHDDGRHNAFTDLARWRDVWWLTFRSGESHVSADGDVVVLRSEDLITWETAARLDTGEDDRDPKLLATDEDLRVYFASYDGTRFQTRLSRTRDGAAWTVPEAIYKPNVWLWRPRWSGPSPHGGRAFWCAAYHMPDVTDLSSWHVDLVGSDDGIAWKKRSLIAAEYCPDECDLWIDARGRMRVIARRDTGPGTALLAEADPPYEDWTLKDLGGVVHAPVVLAEDADRGLPAWVAGRAVEGGAARTAVWQLTRDGLAHLLTLPSGGDTSYPGIVASDGRIIVSYYSEHEYMERPGYQQGSGPASIYVAELSPGGSPNEGVALMPPADLGPLKSRPVVIAHRGFSGMAPENTLVAFGQALELGCDAIECDVHCTADGHVVIMHDATVDRTTDGSGPIAGMTLAELKRLDAGSWKDAAYAGEPVPTLAEALQLIGGRAGLIIEIKQPGIEQAVVDVVRAEGALRRVFVFSFHHESVKRVRAIEPLIPCGWLTGGTQDPSDEAAAALVDQVLTANASMLASHFNGVTDAVRRRVALAGLTLCVWTLDEEEDLRTWVAAGADAIGTNWPNRLLAVLRGK